MNRMMVGRDEYECIGHGRPPHRETPLCGSDPVCAPANEGPYYVPHMLPPEPKAYEPPPSHYATGGIDPWMYIESQQLDYWQGNIVKYITRAGRKDIAAKLDDLKKVRNFVNKYIEIEEKKSG